MASTTSRGSVASKRSGDDPSKRKHRTTIRPNLLEMYPVRNRKWRPKSPGSEEISIMIPRFKSRTGHAFGRLVKATPTVPVNLDAYGSAVWRLCNGRATVGQIGEVLKEQFEEDVEPLFGRLQLFLAQLESHDLISYRDKPEKTKSKSIRTKKQ